MDRATARFQARLLGARKNGCRNRRSLSRARSRLKRARILTRCGCESKKWLYAGCWTIAVAEHKRRAAVGSDKRARAHKLVSHGFSCVVRTLVALHRLSTTATLAAAAAMVASCCACAPNFLSVSAWKRACALAFCNRLFHVSIKIFTQCKRRKLKRSTRVLAVDIFAWSPRLLHSGRRSLSSSMTTARVGRQRRQQRMRCPPRLCKTFDERERAPAFASGARACLRVTTCAASKKAEAIA